MTVSFIFIINHAILRKGEGYEEKKIITGTAGAGHGADDDTGIGIRRIG